MLTGRAIKTTASGLGDFFNRLAALKTGIALAAIDLKLVGEISRFTIGMNKIADRTAAGSNGCGQYGFNHVN
jgi:hypothetical protein